MQRWLIILAVAALAWTIDPASLFAASDWPPVPNVPADFKQFPRGTGYYLSTWKIMSCFFLMLCWAASTDWVSQDCQNRKLDYVLWNSVVFFTFAGFFILVWLIPWFIASFLLLLIAYVAPLAAYVVHRNATAELHEKVFTPAHLRQVASRIVNKFGGKMEAEKKSEHELGPDVQLTAMGGAGERENNINLINARQSPGYLLTRTLIFDAASHRADAIRLDYTQQAVAVQYQIDGVWHNYAPQERAQGDIMLAVMKTLANLNANERRARQSGSLGATVAGSKYVAKITSQGSPTGEIVLVQLEGKRVVFKSLEELGMRAKMQEQLLEVLGRQSGFFLVSAMPAGGLTTTFDILLDSTDRYMRNFVSVEDAAKPERELENVPITKYDTTAGETPDSVLPKLIRTYPDVIVVRDLVNAETVDILYEQVKDENRLVISSIRAKEAVEALLRVLLLKVEPHKLATIASGVLNVRLIRKLCDKCKEAYAPPAEVLKQLGLPPGRIEAFYRPPTPPAETEKVQICQQCLGIGYYGRTAIFELLVIDDDMRQVLATSPKLDLLRAAVRKSKQRTLQEEGLLLVAKGVTSVPELVRVLKG